jgi:hypothetical protein
MAATQDKSGTWIGGAYASGSFASGYPGDSQDIYLSQAAEIDPETGTFALDEKGEPELRENSSLLVNWREIEYLEFNDA